MPPTPDKPKFRIMFFALLVAGIVLIATGAAIPFILNSSSGHMSMDELKSSFKVENTQIDFKDYQGGDEVKFSGTISKVKFVPGPLVLPEGNVLPSGSRQFNSMSYLQFEGGGAIKLVVDGDAEEVSEIRPGAKILATATVFFVQLEGQQYRQMDLLVGSISDISVDNSLIPAVAVAAVGVALLGLAFFFHFTKVPAERERIKAQKAKVEAFNSFKARTQMRAVDPLFDPELQVSGQASPGLPPPPPGPPGAAPPPPGMPPGPPGAPPPPRPPGT